MRHQRARWAALFPARVRQASRNSSMIIRLNVGKSSGLREVTRLTSVATGASTHLAPTFVKSVFKEGQEVMVYPLTPPASIRVHEPCQMTAIGFRSCTK